MKAVRVGIDFCEVVVGRLRRGLVEELGTRVDCWSSAILLVAVLVGESFGTHNNRFLVVVGANNLRRQLKQFQEHNYSYLD